MLFLFLLEYITYLNIIFQIAPFSVLKYSAKAWKIQ